jgi:hypothetical protein
VIVELELNKITKLKEVHRTAKFTWSPFSSLLLLAAATVAGALDESFSNESQLEIRTIFWTETNSTSAHQNCTDPRAMLQIMLGKNYYKLHLLLGTNFKFAYRFNHYYLGLCRRRSSPRTDCHRVGERQIALCDPASILQVLGMV